MRISPAIALLLCRAAAAQAPPAAPNAPADTARYVVLFSDRPAGYYKELRRGDELHSWFEFNDRGRGPHIEFTTRLDTRGVPVAFTATGHAYLKDTVEERFTATSDSARWRSTVEHGTRARPGHAFYVSASGSSAELPLLARAALSLGGRVPLLPDGAATVERAATQTI